MGTLNRINLVLNEKGIKKVVPTDDFLSSNNITLKRFNKIIKNETEITASELQSFSVWLNTPIQNLIEQNEKSSQLQTL